MPQIVVTGTDSPLGAALSSATLSANNAIQAKNVRDRIALSQQASEREEQRFQSNMAEAQRLGEENRAAELASRQFDTARFDVATQGAPEGMQGEFERMRGVIEQLPPEQRQRGIEFAGEQMRKRVIDEDHAEVSQMLAGLVQDGIFEANPNVANQLAQEIQSAQRRGVPADAVRVRLEKARIAAGEEATAAQEWEDVLGRTNLVIDSWGTDTPERQEAVAEAKRIWHTHKNSPSLQGSRSAAIFQEKIQKALLRTLEPEQRLAQFDPQETENDRRVAAIQGLMQQPGFEADPSTELEAPVQAAQQIEEATGLPAPLLATLRTAKTATELAAAFDEAGINPNDLTPEQIELILGKK